MGHQSWTWIRSIASVLTALALLVIAAVAAYTRTRRDTRMAPIDALRVN